MTPAETPTECQACLLVRGLTLSEEEWEGAVLANHHSLYQVAQLGLRMGNAALAAKDARIRELEKKLDEARAAGKTVVEELGNFLMVMEGGLRRALNRKHPEAELLEMQSYCRGVGPKTAEARRATGAWSEVRT